MLNHNSVLIDFSFCSKMPKMYSPKEEIFIWVHCFPPLVTCPFVLKYVARQCTTVGRTPWRYLLTLLPPVSRREEGKGRKPYTISHAFPKFSSISSSSSPLFNVLLFDCCDSGCALRLRGHESASHLNMSE